MEYAKLSAKELARYEKIVNRNRDYILSKEGVVSFGVGYKFVNGERTNTICLLVYVESKGDVKRENRIPVAIEGIPTDVIELSGPEQVGPQDIDLPLVRPDISYSIDYSDDSMVADGRGASPPVADSRGASPPAKASDQIVQQTPTLRVGNQRFDPIMGGMPIHNPNTGQDRVGVLGAIVFDKDTDEPLGLSVQHAIGNQVGNELDEYKKASLGDPINQPPVPEKDDDEIGTLLDYDEDYDAAIFKVNDKRRYEPKMKGLDDEFELNEPVKPEVGMRVECPSRYCYVYGTVLSTMTRSVKNSWGFGTGKYVDMVYIEFQNRSDRTKGGDSGAVWVESSTKRPISLHRGIQGWRFGSGAVDDVAFSTSMQQLVKWYPFRFRQSRKTLLKPEIDSSATEFLDLSTGLLAFCYDSESQKTTVKRFHDFKKTAEKTSSITMQSGVGAAKFNDDIYAVWRSIRSDKIQIAKVNKSDQTIESPSNFRYQTKCKPSLVSFSGKLVMAYTDVNTSRVGIAFSTNGRNWSGFTVSNTNTKFAPALLSLKRKLVLCWVNQSDRKLMLLDLYPSGRSFSLYNRQKLYHNQTSQDPALAVGGGKYYLAYTTLNGQMRVMESSNRRTWTQKISDFRVSHSPPALLYVDDELICIRP